MKTLTLLRHAKSDAGDRAVRDFDRPLNAKGHRAAATVGKHLKKTGAAFDHVVASPAARVISTLEEVERSLGETLAPAWDKRVYLASAITLLDVVHSVDDAHDRLLLVGHNPGLEDLVLMLVPDRTEEKLRDEVEEKFPTASVATLEFDVASWAEVAEGQGHLASFIRPRDLDPALGPDRD